MAEELLSKVWTLDHNQRNCSTCENVHGQDSGSGWYLCSDWNVGLRAWETHQFESFSSVHRCRYQSLRKNDMFVSEANLNVKMSHKDVCVACYLICGCELL